ncbi:5-oxoprolinase subunit PxpB [Marinobacter sp. CHS3-4]|uniref:5-oxoprolinase subunit PxpB n=1 Tax=Marinobacter sp. CHS3-4 TaxID=3045174 RepID=UPI0024B56CB7|nr:5-oxoprolinase subunit PxpB [Marinobacter sp. CHS3-4]MDI9245458.1 5-oxoprolinase subunit PxpB [Marinobacter sp. CHS3-4]
MIRPVSENALLVTLADEIRQELPAQLRSLCEQLEAQKWPWLEDLIPSYTTLLIIYDPDQLDFRQAIAAIRPILAAEGSGSANKPESRTIELPVYYSPESGPDLEALAAACSLSVPDVIEMHTAQTYQVFAMGFAPGFGFLAEVDPAIAHPRKTTPRKSVPAGSVGIANRQTAVYPVSSPGGWQLIGRCPTRLFDRDSLSLLATGDQVRFRSISREDYLAQGGEL